MSGKIIKVDTCSMTKGRSIHIHLRSENGIFFDERSYLRIILIISIPCINSCTVRKSDTDIFYGILEDLGSFFILESNTDIGAVFYDIILYYSAQ